MGRPPDFICIGAQKAGTSWLYANLHRHPDVFMAPKETNHFAPRSRSTDADYLTLFDGAAVRVAGDVSPAYAPLLDAPVHARRVAPNATILYVLRDPVERQWSAMRMRFARDGAAAISASEWVRRIERQAGGHSRYDVNLDRWRSAYGERVIPLFFEQLTEDAHGFFATVCRAIGISERDDPDPSLLARPVFEGPNVPMPDALRKRLSAAFTPTIEACHAEFGNRYTRRWVEALHSATVMP
jgi:hypothetical protein